MQENLLAPNGLTESSFPRLGSDRTLPVPFEAGYSWTKNVSYNVTEDNLSPHVAEGNMYTRSRTCRSLSEAACAAGKESLPWPHSWGVECDLAVRDEVIVRRLSPSAHGGGTTKLLVPSQST